MPNRSSGPCSRLIAASLAVIVGLGVGSFQPAWAQAAKAPEAKAPADARKPKKPDSNARLRPRTVRVKATVEPVEAQPGATVAYRVTATLDPGWHVYDYAKVQPEQGPQATQFDLFDTAGLTIAGDWTPDHPAEVKTEPAFDNLLVASFENEITWSIMLKVPADAAAGPHPLRCQVYLQACDARSCLPPARWTLPSAVVNVVAAAQAARAAAPPPASVAGTGATGLREAMYSAPSAPPAAGTGPTASKPTAVAASSPSVARPAAPPKAVSEVEQKARQGIVSLMIASALGGLLALVMPCVWPMVPITVNFFVKQGEKTRRKPTGLAITYCLAIIGVFTAVGVLCSFFLSAAALPRLANNPWLNFAVAGLFLAFGLSLLGLFEIRLPDALLNASSRGESRGGLVGVMFMALTLTITSFTCTFPVVGGLLVMAARGDFFYPIIGLATFATVLALPFFLLALAPGLLSSLPRSGDWMNAVKVVGGLVEIGAALKFLNTAELAFVTPENAWCDAHFVLTAWIALAAVCGFYLLGFFRTDHDQGEVKVGVGRLILGTSFLGLALFLAPALFGHPPHSLVWDRLVVGLLPPDAISDFSSAPTGPTALATSEMPAAREKHATSTDPDRAQREEKRFHGVWWGFSYEEALERAKAEKKPVLIDFTGVNCANCRLMEARVLPLPEVVATLDKFVTVQLYTPPGVPIASLPTNVRAELGDRNALRELDLTSESTNPLYVVLAPDGTLLGRLGGYLEPDHFVGFLKETLGKFQNASKIARSS